MSDQKKLTDALARIASFPEELSELVTELPDDVLDTPYGEGKWTVRQVVHHLADAHVVLYVRIKKLATEEGPDLPTFDQDAWARTPDTDGPIATSLYVIRAVHERGVQLLKNLPPEVFKRIGNHPVRPWTSPDGKVTLEQLVLHWAKHCDTHLNTLRGFLESR